MIKSAGSTNVRHTAGNDSNGFRQRDTAGAPTREGEKQGSATNHCTLQESEGAQQGSQQRKKAVAASAGTTEVPTTHKNTKMHIYGMLHSQPHHHVQGLNGAQQRGLPAGSTSNYGYDRDPAIWDDEEEEVPPLS